jgi:hypothetical protein
LLEFLEFVGFVEFVELVGFLEFVEFVGSVEIDGDSLRQMEIGGVR